MYMYVCVFLFHRYVCTDRWLFACSAVCWVSPHTHTVRGAIYSCKTCKYAASSPTDSRRHIHTHIQQYTFMCPMCHIVDESIYSDLWNVDMGKSPSLMLDIPRTQPDKTAPLGVKLTSPPKAVGAMVLQWFLVAHEILWDSYFAVALQFSKFGNWSANDC